MKDTEKKEKKKVKPVKIVIIVLIVLAVFTPIQLAVMGWFGGIGPMGSLKDVRMGRMAGNQPQYSFDQITELDNCPLHGGSICALGSSVTLGTASQKNAVGEYLATRFGCSLTKEAVGSTKMSGEKGDTYVNRMLNKLDKSAHFDLFLCQLSTNDAEDGLPLGETVGGDDLSAFDTTTVTGAIEYIIVYAKQTWNCPVVFYTGSYYDSENYAAMVNRVLELKDVHGIGVLDLYTDKDFNNIDDATRKVYMADKIHPTKAGYRDWWGPELERQLLDYLAD